MSLCILEFIGRRTVDSVPRIDYVIVIHVSAVADDAFSCEADYLYLGRAIRFHRFLHFIVLLVKMCAKYQFIPEMHRDIDFFSSSKLGNSTYVILAFWVENCDVYKYSLVFQLLSM